MSDNNKLLFKKDTHQYFLNNEEKHSVSKILSVYYGKNEYFCEKCNIDSSLCDCFNVCSKCDNVRNACVKGKAIHKVAELYFKNVSTDEVVEKIKLKISKIQVYKDEHIWKHTINLLDFLQKTFKKNLTYISEQCFSADIVAGTPDLIFTSKFNLDVIADFKTYKILTKEAQDKAELQLAAYHWLLTKNGYNLSNTHFIIWITDNTVKTISVRITKERLHEWEMALAMFKDGKWNESSTTYERNDI